MFNGKEGVDLGVSEGNAIRLVSYDGFPQKGERQHYLDALKIAAAFAVVMTHIASIGWQIIPVDSWQWLATSVLEIATRFCVPIFFMCSGALLLNPSKHIEPHSLAVRYIGKTAVIAILVSFLFTLLQSAFSGWPGLHGVLRSTLDGPYFIWYLWVLVGLYCLTPLLKVVAADEKLLGYSILLLLFFVMGKSTCNAMIPESDLAVWLNNFIIFSDGAEGVFYYLTGAWLCSHSFSPMARRAVFVSGALSLIAAIALNVHYSLSNGWDLYYVNRDNILIAIYSIAVFVWGKERMREKAILNPLAKAAVSCGLLIYLVHPFVRLIMESCSVFNPFVEYMLQHPVTGITLVTLIVYLVSFGISYLLNRFSNLLSFSAKRFVKTKTGRD